MQSKQAEQLVAQGASSTQLIVICILPAVKACAGCGNFS
jgi:hypothetical protein